MKVCSACRVELVPGRTRSTWREPMQDGPHFHTDVSWIAVNDDRPGPQNVCNYCNTPLVGHNIEVESGNKHEHDEGIYWHAVLRLSLDKQPTPKPVTAQEKREAISILLVGMAKRIAESGIENVWHLDELAQDAKSLDAKIRLAGMQ